MKIGWLTPFNLQSAIGRFSAGATRELARRGHDVEIIMTEVIPIHSHHVTDLPIRQWQSIDDRTLRGEFDLLAVNIGDNYNFHGGIFPALDTLSSLGIFHDFYLYNLFCGWLADNKGARADRRGQEIAQTYSENILNAATNLTDPAQIARLCPMTEWLASRCAGALAHANFYADRLRSTCCGPIDCAHLAWSDKDIPDLRTSDDAHITVLTFGILNANKCAGEVIEAIGGSDSLKNKVDYRLAGSIDPRERDRLEEIARNCGYHRLVVLGSVDDSTLVKEIGGADILCCLRRPVLEGASASAIEAMLSGRPTIVANAGFYAELPDELVFKVPADLEIPALTEMLERLVSDRQKRREIGHNARQWALRHFSFESYVNVLEPLAMKTLDVQPLVAMSALATQELSRLGVRADDPAIDRISARAASLASQPL
jgi:glycosyltransferase involved in cell wall biosynthesis